MIIQLPYKWKPRNYQMPCWQHFERPVENLRGACVWHRRAGKDLLAINLCAVKSQERVGTYWHMLPTYKQGRNIVWNGFTKDGRKFIDHFPKELVASQNQTEMRITFKNDSIYQVVGTDNIDSLVGTNPVGVVFSEYSLHDPAAWDYIRPILAENGGWALFIFTARGKNHGYKLFTMSEKNKKWFSQKLVAGNNGTKREDGSPVVSDELIEDERASNMPEEMIQQEFYCSFEAPLVGAYYSTQMQRMHEQGRICVVPWEPQLPVNTAWDLGVSDGTSIWFFQEFGEEIRVIDYYENSGEGLGHYMKVISGQHEDHRHRLDWTYGKHYAPHDIEVREFSSGKSRIETARELGLKFTPVAVHQVMDGIEHVRTMLPKMYIDEKRCERGIEALRQYRKEWNEKLKIFQDHPFHDWTSHAADSLRVGMWGRRGKKKTNGRATNTAVDKYDYLSTAPQEVEYVD